MHINQQSGHTPTNRFGTTALIIILVMMCSNSYPIQSQNNKTMGKTSKAEIEEIYSVVEQQPIFPGGEDSLMVFIQKHVRHLKTETGEKKAGKVIVRFVIDSTGKATKAEILRGLDPVYDKEALRIIELMPRWTPAKQNGRNVSVYYTIPVRFNADTRQKEEIFSDEIEQPIFPGGYDSLIVFIQKHVRHPKTETGEKQAGKVIVRIIVDSIGRAGKAEIMRTFNPAYDKEALRIIELMPPWTPAKQNGRNVSAPYLVPVRFHTDTQQPVTEKEFNLNDVAALPDIQPSYLGGEHAMLQFIHQNLKVPVYRESEQQSSGRIIAAFVVDAEGHIHNIEILRTFDERYNQAVIDVIRNMPPWTPATYKGKKVPAYYILPVSIKTQ